jgi:hypothetical protein
MQIEGTVHNGVVVLESDALLPEGTRVTVIPQEPADDVGPTIYERYQEIIGAAHGLPADMAENHDHYIHGTPKK